MNTDDVIRELRSWVLTLSYQGPESELHRHVLAKLKAMGLDYNDRGALSNPSGGVSRPDILVTNKNPNILIELKAEADWTHVSQAAWQLFQAAGLLEAQGTMTRRLAIFGDEMKDPILCKFLKALEIEFECIQRGLP